MPFGPGSMPSTTQASVIGLERCGLLGVGVGLGGASRGGGGGGGSGGSGGCLFNDGPRLCAAALRRFPFGLPDCTAVFLVLGFGVICVLLQRGAGTGALAAFLLASHARASSAVRSQFVRSPAASVYSLMYCVCSTITCALPQEACRRSRVQHDAAHGDPMRLLWMHAHTLAASAYLEALPRQLVRHSLGPYFVHEVSHLFALANAPVVQRMERHVVKRVCAVEIILLSAILAMHLDLELLHLRRPHMQTLSARRFCMWFHMFLGKKCARRKSRPSYCVAVGRIP